MSGDEMGGNIEIKSGPRSATRRIQSFDGVGKEEQIAKHIRMHVSSLNTLFEEARKVELDVELSLNGPTDVSDTQIVIDKLRIEKDF